MDRIARRRQAVMDEALTHAIDIMTEKGVGGLTVVEVARRSGIRGPSLYKYFDSLHALYDSLFARGLQAQLGAVRAATADAEPGVMRMRAAAQALVRWASANPALAQLLFWRVVPSFTPSPTTLAASSQDMAELRAELREAVARGELRPEADTQEALRLWTVVLSGVISQQMANDPGATYEEGTFSQLTDRAVDLFITTYQNPIAGGPHATTGP
ncbi:TetR/AcrR family transcriptional regulator [Knoellia sp. CPCC 206435]|uniref:TetR/AcrR family transcriptional regulator n=1 Tax=Knoellia terrae TaxID=3404797 RepID=UPI003B43273E